MAISLAGKLGTINFSTGDRAQNLQTNNRMQSSKYFCFFIPVHGPSKGHGTSCIDTELQLRKSLACNWIRRQKMYNWYSKKKIWHYWQWYNGKTNVIKQYLTTLQWRHMNAMGSQITSNSIVWLTVIQANLKEDIKAPKCWPFVRGIHWRTVDSPHNWSLTWKCFNVMTG